MSTSIITTTTFTIATGIDVGVALPITSPAVETAAVENFVEDTDIEACLLAAFPRCGWTTRKRCGHLKSCKS